MTEVKSSGFLIHDNGDESVGIFSQQWSLTGDFVFETAADLEAFKNKLCEAFEYVTGAPVWAETLEERSAVINAEIFDFGAFHFV